MVWSWKVLEILVQGPGKSWNFLGYDVGGGRNDAGANLWLPLDTQNRKGIQLQAGGGALPHAPPPCSFWTICLLFLSYSD